MARPRRLPAFIYVGCQRYFLTICTHERRKWFADGANVALVHEQILNISRRDEFDITAYCYMPDHLHALVTGGTDDADLGRFVHGAKQRSGWLFSQTERRRLWQKGYYERVLRDEETTPAVVEYIVNNPLRAGLVDRPMDYAHWGSSSCSRVDLLELISRGGRWRP
jgi:REP-associated tyrosine transposase